MSDDEHERQKKNCQQLIQSRLGEMTRILNEEVLPAARQYQIEFSFLGMEYHLYPMGHSAEDPGEDEVFSQSKGEYRYEPRQPAKEGLLVADDEWCSSTFGCSRRYWDWHMKNWPERNED